MVTFLIILVVTISWLSLTFLGYYLTKIETVKVYNMEWTKGRCLVSLLISLVCWYVVIPGSLCEILGSSKKFNKWLDEESKW